MIEVTYIAHLLWVKSALVTGEQMGEVRISCLNITPSCSVQKQRPTPAADMSFVSSRRKWTKGHVFLVNSILDPLKCPEDPEVGCLNRSPSEGSLLIIALKRWREQTLCPGMLARVVFVEKDLSRGHMLCPISPYGHSASTASQQTASL